MTHAMRARSRRRQETIGPVRFERVCTHLKPPAESDELADENPRAAPPTDSSFGLEIPQIAGRRRAERIERLELVADVRIGKRNRVLRRRSLLQSRSKHVQIRRTLHLLADDVSEPDELVARLL